eukprot:7411995-Pyramimonas_sp.AAC.1
MTVATLGSEPQKLAGTLAIRAQLPTRGNAPNVLNAARDHLDERPAVIQHGQLSELEFQRNKLVHDTFLPSQ